MITKEQIEQLASAELTDTDLYVAEVTISPASDIELLIDSDTRVGIDNCVKLSRSIEEKLEALGEEDFSLMVASWGIGNPFKVARQYARCIGGDVEVLFVNGKKITAKLENYDGEAITISYEEKVAIEGKKRKELVHKEERHPINEIKSVREALTIK